MISTNECRYTDIELREELSELGINVPNKWCIYTAGMAVRDFLKKKIENKKNKKYYLGIIGERGLFETINTLTSNSCFATCLSARKKDPKHKVQHKPIKQ